MSEPWKPQTNGNRCNRTVIQKLVEPGIKSPATTLIGVLPAVYFIIGDLMRIMEEAGPDQLEKADIKDIVMWLAIAAIGWFSRSHNVSSSSSGVDQ